MILTFFFLGELGLLQRAVGAARVRFEISHTPDWSLDPANKSNLYRSLVGKHLIFELFNHPNKKVAESRVADSRVVDSRVADNRVVDSRVAENKSN